MAAQRALAALVVVVGIVAIGAAAAGVDDPTRTSGPSEAPGQGPGEGPGQVGEGDAPGAQPGDAIGLPSLTIEAYFFIALAGLTVLGLLTAALLIYYDGLEGLLRLLSYYLHTATGVSLFVLLLVGMVWWGVDLSTLGEPDVASPDPGGGDPEAEVPETGTGIPPIVLALGGIALLVVTGLLLWTRRGDDEGEPVERHEGVDVEEIDGETGQEPPAPTPRAEQSPDNAVYRAWYDLARRVGVAHERNWTPGEVAEAAIEEGLPQKQVRTITDLFSEVRYGHRPVTQERERRAESALDGIDATGGES